MINLSNKTATRFKVKWKDLEERSGDFWKVDIMMIGRIPMLLIVHEYTLFTIIRRKSTFQNLHSVATDILKSCPWYNGSKSLSLGKNGNRQLNGSINEIKRITVGLYSPEQINSMEMAINQCIYSYLSTEKRDYLNPFEAVESYVKGKTPWL
ncbi:MAG: hypothetical protein GY699_06980 [Desulfobacteraceae bacterium]|nr:hypothetical protein [Desulfobacteraceae bacterium]